MKRALSSWKSLLGCLALVFAFAVSARAQVESPEATGIDPAGSYTGGKFDNVDISNGNVNLHIPLMSYKQKGKLSLSFSLDENTNLYHASLDCDMYEACYAFYAANPELFGPQITFDQGMSVTADTSQTAYSFSYGDFQESQINYWVTQVQAEDNLGGIHTLGFDSTSFPAPNHQGTSTILMHANDGSGYTLVTDPEIYGIGGEDPTETLTNADGVSMLPTGASSDIDMTDPDGNAIHSYNTTNPETGDVESTYYVDSVGRTIPAPPPLAGGYTTSTAGCPTLGYANQPLVGSESWTVPGPGPDGTSTYLVCYTSFSIHPEFFGIPSPILESYPFPGDTGQDSSTGPTNPLTFDLTPTENPIQSIVLPDGKSYWAFQYDVTVAGPDYDPETNPGGWPASYGMPTQITLPTGGTVSYTYTPQTLCYLPDVDSLLQANLTASTRTVNDNNGNVGKWTYTLRGPNGPVVTDPLLNDSQYTFTDLSGGGCAMYQTELKQFQGPLGNGDLLQDTTTTQYLTVKSPQTLEFSDADHITDVLPQTVNVSRNGALYSVTTYSYPSLFTNVQPLVDLGDQNNLLVSDPTTGATTFPVSFNQPSGVVVTGAQGQVLKSTTTQYQYEQNPANPAYLTANLLNLHSVDTNWSGNTIAAETQYNYDEGESGVFGNQTSVHQLLNGNMVQTSSATYNASGMPVTTTDANLNTTTFNYDGSGVYYSSVQPPTTNGISHTSVYQFQDSTGLLQSQTDPNGVMTNYGYDTMGRLTSVDSAVGLPAEAKTMYAYPGTTEMDTNQDQTTLGDGLLSSKVLYDGLARPIHQTQPSGATVDTTYDLDGNVASTSNPYFSTSDSTYGVTGYAYDALGRKHYQCQPDNGNINPCTPGSSYLRWEPTGASTDFYDEAGHHSQSTTDGLGRLVTVLEPDATNTPNISTTYGYDSNGNLSLVTQQGASGDTPRTRGFSYDSLSRLINATNPETGTVSYTYDLDGNLATKTDARGAVVGYCYDQLNRMTYKFYTGSFNCSAPSGYAAQYSYDASSAPGAQYTAGRLTDEKSYAGGSLVSERQPYAYDPMGRLLNENQYTYAASSTPYPVAYLYDLAGNLRASTDGITPPQTLSALTPCPGNSISPPSWTTLTVYRCYDNGGRLLSVNTNWSDATHPPSLFSSPAYAGFGGLTGAALSGSALNLSRTFDNRLRLSIESDTGSGNSPATAGSATVTVTGAEQSQ